MDDVTTIKELREAFGYSLRKTSLLVGLSTSELSRVEHGERRLTGAARGRFIDAFDLTASDVGLIRELTPFSSEVPA